MTGDDRTLLTQRIEEVLGEFKGMIAERFPQATFAVERGDDPPGIYLVATVDVEDADDVFAVVVERLLEVQIEEGLPVYVTAIRPVERTLAELRAREASANPAPLPV